MCVHTCMHINVYMYIKVTCVCACVERLYLQYVCMYTHTHIYMCVCVYTNIYTWSFRAFLVVQTVKNLPAVQETRVHSLGWEDPLEKGMATYSSLGFPDSSAGKESHLPGRRPWFNSWVMKIPWRRDKLQ